MNEKRILTDTEFNDTEFLGMLEYLYLEAERKALIYPTEEELYEEALEEMEEELCEPNLLEGMEKVLAKT